MTLTTSSSRSRDGTVPSCSESAGTTTEKMSTEASESPHHHGEAQRRSAERVWNVEERINDVRQEMDSLGEDVEDL